MTSRPLILLLVWGLLHSVRKLSALSIESFSSCPKEEREDSRRSEAVREVPLSQSCRVEGEKGLIRRRRMGSGMREDKCDYDLRLHSQLTGRKTGNV
jgi:hypothetical protein